MLAIFAYTTDYSSWRDSSNWMTSSLHGHWTGWNGVELQGSTNRIIKLGLNFLENNQLAGTIPTELGELTALTSLSLDQNQLIGPIPTELGELTDLYVLSLHSNQLTGPIPSQLGELTDLMRLSLNANTLTGPIPSELGLLNDLTHLNLRDNQLEMPGPDEVCILLAAGLNIDLDDNIFCPE